MAFQTSHFRLTVLERRILAIRHGMHHDESILLRRRISRSGFTPSWNGSIAPVDG